MEIDWEAPETLRLLLIYLELTGQLFWKERPAWMFPRAQDAATWNKRWAGKPAFTATDRKGYHIGAINARGRLAHRVIWAWVTGAWPEEGMEVDHIDGNPANNVFSNLRLVSQSQQMWNRRNITRRSARQSGLPRGVALRTDRAAGQGKCYRANIWLHGKCICLGYFTTPEEASEAYLKAVTELHGDHSFHLSRS